MKTDVLFWFYKDFDTCRERLKRLKRLNNGVRVFALYGGPLHEAAHAQESLQAWVDDFYVYPEARDARWKWKHGDQMIATWYKQRGQSLEWETLFVMQWDMLVLAPLEQLFAELQPGEILLSGFIPLSTVAPWWPWADSENADLLAFKAWLRDRSAYDDELYACLFIVVCLPRIFLKRYVDIGHPEVGFLEYKLPTLAHIFGIPVCTKHNFEPWWRANPATKNIPWSQRILNAVAEEIPLAVILQELAKSDGKRLFHPVFRTLPRVMENRYVALVCSRTLPLLQPGFQGMRKLKQYARNLARRLP